MDEPGRSHPRGGAWAAELAHLTVHDHACALLEDADELAVSLAGFVRAGLEAGEHCLCVAAPPVTARVAALLAGAPNAARLRLLAPADLALAPPRLELAGALAALGEAAAGAGAGGLHLAVALDWDFSRPELREAAGEWEAGLAQLVSVGRVRCLCAYHRPAVPWPLLADLVIAHPLVARGEDERVRLGGHRSATRALEVERKDLLDILTRAVGGYWIVDVATGDAYYSPGFFAALGYAPGELRAEPQLWRQLMLPEDAARLGDALERHLHSHGSGAFRQEARYRRRDGSIAHFVCSIEVTAWDPSGRPQRIVGCHQDVTAQRQAEHEVVRSRDLAQQLISSSMDGFWINDDQGRILEVNDHYLAMSGWSRAELLAMSIADIDLDESPELLLGHIADIKRGVSRRFEARHRCKDGSILDVEVSVSPLPGDPGKLVAFTRDVTEHRRSRREAQLEQRRMAAILGLAEADGLGAAALLDSAAEHAVALTGSRLGFIFHHDSERGALVLSAWSRDALERSGLAGGQTVWTLDEAGLWGEVVRQARPLIAEDPWAAAAAERRLPEGHVPVPRMLAVPVRDAGRIGAVLAVGGKPQPYEEAESRQLAIFAQDVWKVVARKRVEEALAQSRKMYTELVESAQDLVWQCDPEGRYVYLNPAFEAVFGYPVTRMLGRHFSDFQEPAHAERDRRVFQRLLAGSGARIKGHETVHLGKDGRRLHLVFNARSLLDDRGEVVGTHGTAYDITERKWAEEAMRRSSRMLHEAQKVARLGSYTLTVATGKWVTSAVLDEVLGIDHEHPRDLDSWAQLIHPDDRQGMVRYFQEQVLGQRTPFNREYRIVRPSDGAERWVHGRGELVIGVDGQVLEMFGTIQDITERKQVESALRESEAKFRMLSEVSLIGIIVSQDARVKYVNQAAAEISGRAVEDLLAGDAWALRHDLFPGQDVEITGEPQEGHESHRTLLLRRPDGTERWIERYVKTVPFEERLAYFITVLDVTDRVLADERQALLEEQLLHSQKLESVGRLAGGVAHDINNMLTPILGYARILEQELGQDHPHRAPVEEIGSAAERIRDMTQQLLAFARKQTLELKRLDLRTVIASFERMLRRTLRENVHIETHLTERPLTCRGDPRQIEQILLNLAVNAQDAMPQGGRLIITASDLELGGGASSRIDGPAPGRYVCLEVSDSGVGMGQEVLDKIFEPFFTTKELGRGTGLGLSTVYGIVRQHGGHISVTSVVGKGSTFRILFPWTAGTETAEPTPAPGVARGGSETILVVEDQEQVLRLTASALKRQGYEVFTAGDGAAALDLVRRLARPLQLVITDVVMPDMNGKALYEALQKLQPGLEVLYMSGYPADVIGTEGVLDAGTELLQKPFTLDGLAQRVRSVLDRRFVAAG
jgi:PAS domain S-box-containing protein